MANIQWKDIPEFEDYQVSSEGLVRSKPKPNIRSTKGKLHKEKVRKQSVRGGYKLVRLFNTNGSKCFSVHRLVAQAFIENPNNKCDVNHINGIKHDNRLENLEWCTRKENQHHAVVNNLYASVKGEQHHNSKLKEADIISIRKMYKGKGKGKTHKEIADIYNVRKTTITCILSNKVWKHVKCG